MWHMSFKYSARTDIYWTRYDPIKFGFLVRGYDQRISTEIAQTSDPYNSASISKWCLFVGFGSSSTTSRNCDRHSGGRTTEAVYNIRFVPMYTVDENIRFDLFQGVNPNTTFDLA